MTGFKPGSSGIGSDRSANCATTTSRRSFFTGQRDVHRLRTDRSKWNEKFSLFSIHHHDDDDDDDDEDDDDNDDDDNDDDDDDDDDVKMTK